LWLMQRSIFGEPSPLVEGQKDIGLREIAILVPLMILVLTIGLYWNALLQFTDPIATGLAKLFGA